MEALLHDGAFVHVMCCLELCLATPQSSLLSDWWPAVLGPQLMARQGCTYLDLTCLQKSQGPNVSQRIDSSNLTYRLRDRW